MFIDFNYYTTVFGGTVLTEVNFSRHASKACDYISNATMLRVTDQTIGSFPNELVTRIKKCACDIAESLYYFDQIKRKELVESADNAGIGKIRNKKAGQVSVTWFYGSSNYSDSKYKESYLKDILMEYLSPVKIDGVIWNLTSKVMSNHRHHCCYI